MQKKNIMDKNDFMLYTLLKVSFLAIIFRAILPFLAGKN